jgi:hypothetical protein
MQINSSSPEQNSNPLFHVRLYLTRRTTFTNCALILKSLTDVRDIRTRNAANLCYSANLTLQVTVTKLSRPAWLVRIANPRLHSNRGKGKVPNLSTHHAMKTHRGSGGITPRILKLATRCRWMVSSRPGRLIPGEKPPVSTGYEAWWAQEPVRTR